MRKKLMLETFKEAYRKTGLLPVQGEWTKFVEGKKCACGLAALCMAEGKEYDPYTVSITEVTNFLREKGYEISEAFAEGFMQGFDDVKPDVPRRILKKEFKNGFELGREVQKMIRKGRIEDVEILGS